MSLNLGGDGVITGCTSLSEPALTLSGLTVDTDTLVVDSANNRVGIGTSSPGALLDVVASDGLSTTIDSEVIVIDVSAPVNSGGSTTNPLKLGSRRTVEGGNTGSQAETFIRGSRGKIAFDTGSVGAGIAAQITYSSDSFSTQESALTVKTDGNVGIGTSSPDYNLTVATGSSATLNVKTTSDNTAPRAARVVWSFDDGDGAAINAVRASSEAATDVDLTFRTGGITNAEERLRILSTGGLTFNGDTAAANALDDYEEGTWTPGIEGVSTAGSYTFTGSGGYTKIGNKVTVWGQLIDITTVSAGSGNARITGLPFISALGFDAMGSILLDQWALSSTAYIDVVASISDGVNHMNPRIVRDSATDISLGITAKSSDNADVKFCITYTVA